MALIASGLRALQFKPADDEDFERTKGLVTQDYRPERGTIG